MYVLITPAKNEEVYIEGTIKSVISQTILPAKWVIVNDGSHDGTDEIVRHYANRYDFIKLLAVSGHSGPDFGSKVNAFNAGLATIKNEAFGFIGNLDADVSFEKEYFAKILKLFYENERIGIAGGMILELIDGLYVAQNVSLNSVAGAVQLFRRQCYEDIGGYIGIKSGGIDAAAEIMARARGWEVRTAPEIHVLHRRRVVTGTKSVLLTRFKQGMTNYRLGYDPLFQIASCLYQMAKRPYVIGGPLILIGYLWALIRRTKRLLPPDVRTYLKTEQRNRLTGLMSREKRSE